MVKRAFIIGWIVPVLFCTPSTTKGEIYFDDGELHIINYEINDGITLDFNSSEGTRLEIVEGGYVAGVSAYGSSQVTLSGGAVDEMVFFNSSNLFLNSGSLWAVTLIDDTHITMNGGTVSNEIVLTDNATLDAFGGYVDHIAALHYAQVDFGGDCTVRAISVLDFCNMTISGGTIEDKIFAGSLLSRNWPHQSLITIEGSDFQVNGQPVNYGDFASDYAVPTPFYSYTLQGGVLTGVLANGNELNSTFYIIEEADITFAIPEPKRVEIDIKPTSCPNPLNVDSGGVLPVAVLGSDEFDVTTVDIASVRLAGVAPMRSSYEDVSSPVADANDCTCTTAGGDGYDDLTLKFKTRQIVEALVAAEVDLSSGEELTLTFTGALSDGTPIEGADCMVVVGQVPRSIHAKRSDINGDGVVNMLDVAMVADNWLESSVVED